MRRAGRTKTWLLDICGGAALAALLAAGAYFGLVEGRDAAAELSSAAAEVATRRRDLASLQNVASRQRALLAEKEKQLAQSGRLPHETPNEEYFEHLSALATQHRLRILRHNPVPSQDYPGLREDRFVFDVLGSFPDLVEFFRAIESAAYWADVSYLKISSVRHEGAPDRSATTVANLTVSLFSAPRQDAKAQPG